MHIRNSGLIAPAALALALAASACASAQQAATQAQPRAAAPAQPQAAAEGAGQNAASSALRALGAPAAAPAAAPVTPPGAAASAGDAARPAPAAGGAGASTSLLGGQPANVAGVMKLEPGLYRCELSRRVVVRRIEDDGQSMVINWQGKDHTLNAVAARTGALRFENAQEGLMWLVIVGKSMLLDMRRGQQLANECTL